MPVKVKPLSHALTRAWTQLSAEQKSAVAPLLLQVGDDAINGAVPELGDRFTSSHAPSVQPGDKAKGHTAAPATLVRHAVPSAADLKRVDTLVGVALAGVEQLPSAAALLEKVFSRAAWSAGATVAAHALAGVSLAETWRGLVAQGRVLVVGAGGLGGDAAHVDPRGDIRLDAKTLARLPAEERRFVVVRAVIEAALHAAALKGPPGPNRDHGASPGLLAARATALARALLSNASSLDLHGKALYYPAGGSDVKSVRGVAEHVGGIGSVVSIDIAYKDTHALSVTDGLTFHATPGDALAGDVKAVVRAQSGASIGGVQLLAPGDFGGLRKEASFIATTLRALDVGGVVFNHHLWGYAPLTRQLPPAFLGLTLTDVIGTDGHGDVEVLTKTRELKDAVQRAVHTADRLVACFVERMQSGRLGQLLSDDAWARPFIERREPYLPELALLARTLEAVGDPQLSGLVWQRLLLESERPGAHLTEEERCVITAHAMTSSACGGVPLKDTSVGAHTMSTPLSPPSSSSSAAEAAAWVARRIAGETLPGTIADELAAIERMLPLCLGEMPRDARDLSEARTWASFFTARLATLSPSSPDLSSWIDAGVAALHRAVFGLIVTAEGAGDAALLSGLVAAVEHARTALEGAGPQASALRDRLSLTALVAEAEARRASLSQG